MNWQPTISLSYLKSRADILQKIRHFFAERSVLEVETPLLCETTATDPHIHSFFCEKANRYLQTSPEFPMKRLLSMGSGPIYQLCKAFRKEEMGRLHNPEFTILEWYRPDFDHHDLMQEMSDFLEAILNVPPAQKFTYENLFLKYLSLNPHTASLEELIAVGEQHEFHVTTSNSESIPLLTRDDWLQLLMANFIEPHLGFSSPALVYDFPSSQAALAQIKKREHYSIAERFEVYVQGIELANGYHELGNAEEQKTRFLKDIVTRKKLNYPEIPLDNRLLQALSTSFPNCAGVALGIDRLILLALQAETISEVMTFDWNHC